MVSAGSYRILQDPIGFYRILQHSIAFYNIIQHSIACILQHSIALCSTLYDCIHFYIEITIGLYRILQDPTGSYRVLQNSIGLYARSLGFCIRLYDLYMMLKHLQCLQILNKSLWQKSQGFVDLRFGLGRVDSIYGSCSTAMQAWIYMIYKATTALKPYEFIWFLRQRP